ncbi:MAG: hypothetical protein ACWA49_13955 [Ruegeria sp.]
MLTLTTNILKIFGICFLRFQPMPRLWVIWLVAVNLGCVGFIARPEGQVVLAVTLVAVLAQAVLFGRMGFTRVLGITHVLWIPMFAWLASRVDAMATTPGLTEWVALLFVTNLASFVIDLADAHRFIRGDRAPHYTWARG